MKKKYTPKLLIKYLLKEFSFSLLIFLSIFFSLIIISTYFEEIIFFREKNLEGNIYIKIFFLALIKTPTLLISMSPFIFLFSGIFFFAKLLRNNEISPLSISGFSHNFISLIPALFSFFIGIFIILILTPVTSELSKYYESFKRKYSENENLIIMTSNGLWIKEQKNNQVNIIRTDPIKDENFTELKNITIYKFNNQNDLEERIDSRYVIINKKNWILTNSIVTTLNKKQNKDVIYNTNININELKKYFINAKVFSIWNILQEKNKLNQRGYYGQELVITFHKYLSLPFMLFGLIILTTFFTIRTGYTFNNFIYAFYGIISGITIYFLSDLSIAIGKSGKIPLELSVWFPIIIIMTISIYSLLKEK